MRDTRFRVSGTEIVRLIGVLACCLAVLYLGVGIWGLSRAEWAENLILLGQYNQIPEAAGIDVNVWKPAWRGGMTAAVALGIASLAAGVGLLRCKGWGRRLWLILVILFVGLHVFWGLADGGQGRTILERLVEVGGVVALAAFSWSMLNREAVVTAVRDDAATATTGNDGYDEMDSKPGESASEGE
jgi:hypothetical protein